MKYPNMYWCTNESLKSIVNGLDVNSQDEILAICGSGDQAFAILELAKRVVAIDKNSKQLELAEERRDMIKEGDFKFFWNNHLYLADKDKRKSVFNKRKLYFNKERLRRIKNNIDNLSFLNEDIFYIGNNGNNLGSFTKIYLSNAQGVIENILSLIPLGGLIYYSFNEKEYPESDDEKHSKIISRPLFLKEELTEKARMYENRWYPLVYEKVSE